MLWLLLLLLMLFIPSLAGALIWLETRAHAAARQAAEATPAEGASAEPAA
jgi:hypothetical protein